MLSIKVDEDLPPAIVQLLKSAGHDPASVLEQDMGGWKDADIWKAIQAEKRFLITGDKGFGDIRAYPPGTHSGALILRPDEDGIRPITELVEQVLSKYNLGDLAGTITIATVRGVRIRKAAPQTDKDDEEQA